MDTLQITPKKTWGPTNKYILRTAIISELRGINLYERLIDMVEDEDIKDLLLEILKDKKSHLGELFRALLEIDKEQAEEMKLEHKEIEDALEREFKEVFGED